MLHDYTKYFKETGGFERFIKKIYDKYKSLGKFSGTIKLNNLSLKESLVLSRLFGITYHEGQDISISVNKFITIMLNSKYEDFDINILVAEYLNVSLISNKEKKDNDKVEEWEFYQNIMSNNSVGSKWIEEVITKKINPYKMFVQKYHKNKLSLKRELINIVKLIDNLPSKTTLLSIFSSNYTMDPHYLDLDNNNSILFMYALSYIDNCKLPKNREEKIKLMSKYHIEIDNLSNYVLTYNLISDKEAINGFSKNKESLILNLQNILSTNKFDAINKKVFIFENPSILTEIMYQKLDVSIIIAGGFPNICIYLLLDKLLEGGTTLYYNGDFDPEGLLIAEKLKEKYNNLNFICYEEIDYYNCISDKIISEKRLKKLSKIQSVELLGIKKLLLTKKLAAYQENNKENIINMLTSLK